ncbi:hypothetical protein EV383_4332 [Pseudonocardia sediminis]|uniref:Uncharacterized protein n=1 Tax=Pseudonocardia sediminis TaxID=1397368 RepID=A0A4Q7V481_PSEST|nr:hypothetical protein [Pseudonocardia sediminis]RZT87409.1 hypothetical protein EV383_4332 [Pseudonocardia sediminis]
MTAPWHDVEVVWPDGSKSEDGIRGSDRDHALENAEWNWISGNPYGRAERIEYVGPSPTPVDWWAAHSVSADDEVDVL